MMDEERPDKPDREDSYFDLPGAEKRPSGKPDDGAEKRPSGKPDDVKDDDTGAGAGQGAAGPGDGDSQPSGSVGTELDLGQWLKEGWELIKPELPGYIIASIILTAITVISLKIITPITYLAVVGPLTAGFFLMMVNHMHGRRPLITDLFHAFQKYIPATIAHIIITIFLTFGFILCFIPALIIWGMYLFTFLFIVDGGLDFWEAMEASRKVAAQNYLEFALFALVLFVLNLGGLLCCGVGLFITVPLTFASVTCAYRDLVGLAKEPAVKTPPPVEKPPQPPEYPDIIS